MELVPEALERMFICACIRVGSGRNVNAAEHLWYTDAPLICILAPPPSLSTLASVVLQMNKCMDAVCWVQLYYFWSIVRQHKQVDSLIPFHLARVACV